MKQNRFHKYFPTKGYNLHLILLAYLLAGFFYPVIGLLALICMIAPVAGGVGGAATHAPAETCMTVCLQNIRLTVRFRLLSGRRGSERLWFCLYLPYSEYRCILHGATGTRWDGCSGT